MAIVYRRCIACGLDKPLNEFRSDPQLPGKRTRTCLACIQATGLGGTEQRYNVAPEGFWERLKREQGDERLGPPPSVGVLKERLLARVRP